MLDPLSISFSQSVPSAPRPSLPQRKLLQPSPDHPDDYVLELDYSHGLGSFCVCPTLWRNLNISSRESDRPNNATQFGTLFHSCEELRLQHGWSDALQQKQFEMVAAHFAQHPAPPDEYRTANRMMNVLQKYNAKFAKPESLFYDSWENDIVVHEGKKLLERAFKIPVCTIEIAKTLPYTHNQLVIERKGHGNQIYIQNLHIVFTGKIDCILRNSNFLFVVDHKTTSRDEREVTEAFHTSLQTRGYVWAAQRLGFPVAGCIINSVLVRPPAKTERAAKPREDFQRHTYFYDADRIADFEDSLRLHVSTLVHYLTQGAFPQVALSFKSPCPNCDYFDNCRLPRSQRAADLASGMYRDVTWSPINE